MFLRKIIFAAAVIAAFVMASDVPAAPIEIVKGAQRSFRQPTLNIKAINGDQDLCQPFYRYLATCGWFRVVKGEADYDLSFTGGDGRIIMLLEFSGNPVLHKNITYQGDVRRAAARAVDELIQARFKQRLCDSQLVFTAETRRGHKEVFVCDTDGGNLRKVTEFSNTCVEPSWMPDGKSVVYTRYSASGTDLCETMLNPWRTRRLTSFRGMNVGASVHPSGNFLAMIMSIDRQVELYVKALNGRERRRLTQSKAVEASPCWHPSGSMICFVSDRSGRPGLYLIGANGGQSQRVPTVGSEAVTPSWSPDGKLAYSAKVGGSYKIAVYDPKGGESGVIANLPNGDWEAPTWAPDSRHLAASRRLGRHSEIYIVDSKTGEARKLLNLKFSQSSPDWSPIRRD